MDRRLCKHRVIRTNEAKGSLLSKQFSNPSEEAFFEVPEEGELAEQETVS